MVKKTPRIKLYNSVVKNKMPEAETSSIGELFINANAERPFISTKDSNGDMKKVIFEDEINADMEALGNRITDETKRATEAENVLTTNLNGEIDRAKKAEKVLADNHNQEITNRTEEIARVDGKIDTEIVDRKSADSAIIKSLEAEIARAKKAESEISGIMLGDTSALTKSINDEVARAKTAEKTLTDNLNGEISRAKEAENVLTTKLNEEITNRTEADNALDAKISAETENRVVDKESLTKSITDETARAISAETTNKNAIDSEVVRAKGVEKSLQDQITKLKNDTSSSDALNAEISARTEADKALEAKIKAVSDTACKVTDVTINGVSVVTEKVANIDLSSKADVSALTTETSARENGDSRLTSSITKEVSDRKSEITRVEGVIANETSARVSAITSLNSEIADLKANGGKIQDVTVNGVTVVANKVANIDLSNYLDKSTYNTDKQAIDDTLSNKADLVNGRIPLEQLGNLDTNILIIANDLPTSDIKENKIYLVPSQTSGETNIYTEYVYINSAWEILGSYTSSVDTSNFVLRSELEADEQAIAAAFNVIRKEYTDKFANYVLKVDYDVLKTNYDTLKADYDTLKADYDALKVDVLRRLTAIESLDALDAGNY